MRITLDISDQLFKKVKTHAAQNDITIKDFIIGLLNKEFQSKRKQPNTGVLDRNRYGILNRKIGKEFGYQEIERLKEEIVF